MMHALNKEEVSTKKIMIITFEREYLVTSLIMPEQHFHFHSVVADRLQNHPFY